MLLEFRIKNFLSFKDETVFSLMASPEKEHAEHLLSPGKGWDTRVLRGAVVSGPNAAGKSNLVKALYYMKRLVIDSGPRGQEGISLNRKPFRLHPDLPHEPSEFEVFLNLDGIRYQYGFTLVNNWVSTEWLFAREADGRGAGRKVFTRDGTEYEFGKEFRRELEPLTERTRINALYCSVAATWNGPVCRDVVEWFSTQLFFLPDYLFLGKRIKADDQHIEWLNSSIRVADFGINKVAEDAMKENGAPKAGAQGEAGTDNSKPPYSFFQHEAVLDDGQKFPYAFHVGEESRGTVRFIDYAPYWHHALTQPVTLIVDAFDEPFHTEMAKWLLAQLLHPDEGAPASQLVAITHNTNLLDADLLRRDQIWFAEKGRDGATDLFSLYDFVDEKGDKVDRRANFAKQYLEGRYGAIPILPSWK